jgi:hypothetical protein
MPKTLQSYITEVAPTSSADLAPLVANSTYQKAVDAELALRDKAAEAAAAVAALQDDLHTGVAPFAAAMSGLRAVAKRFPETAKFIDEAAKQVQLAMGVVAYNPPPVAKPLPPATATGVAPTPPAPPQPLVTP